MPLGNSNPKFFKRPPPNSHPHTYFYSFPNKCPFPECSPTVGEKEEKEKAQPYHQPQFEQSEGSFSGKTELMGYFDYSEDLSTVEDEFAFFLFETQTELNDMLSQQFRRG